MRIAALVLAVGFGGLQAFFYTNCRCPDAFSHARARKSRTCAHCEGARSPEHQKDCCHEPAAPGHGDCIHLHPSSDVVASAPVADAVPPPVLILPLLTIEPAAPGVPPSMASDAPLRPARGRPLFLLLSSLLI